MRYNLQLSERPDYFVCTDTENLIVCVFKDKNFNNDQKFTVLNDFDPKNYMKLAQLAREMGDWLNENHKEKVFKK